MKIAIIGSGNVGSALGTSLTKAGHAVTFTARDPEKVRQVATTAGAAVSASPAAAAAAADVIIIAVPYGAVTDVAAEIAPAVAGKVVIDATNPLKPDYSGLATDVTSGAEQIAAALPGATIVKAFNTLFAGVQGNPEVHGTTLDALYATDSEAAAATVAAIASSIGFRPVRVGPLAAARELEALAWLNIRLQVIAGGAWQTSYLLVAAPPAAVAA